MDELMSIKQDIITNKQDIKNIQKKNSLVLLGSNSIINIYNTAKYQMINVNKNIKIIIKEKEFIETNILFNGYGIYSVTVEDFHGNIIKTISTQAGKSYNVSIKKLAPFMPLIVEDVETPYTGAISIEDLIIWFNASDLDKLAVSTTSSPMHEHFDRMGKQKYLGSSIDDRYTGTNAIKLTSNNWKCGGEVSVLAYFVSIGSGYSTNQQILDYGTTLNGFNGEEFTLQINYITGVPKAAASESYIFYLGDESGTTFLSAKSGKDGYIHSSEDGVVNPICRTGLTYSQRAYISLTYSKSAGKCIVYFNGIKNIEIPVTKTLGSKLILGASLEATPTSESPFVGYCIVQDFRLYNRVLSEEELLANEKIVEESEGVVY